MNERIFTELYKKVWGHFPCPTGEPELEKFAELIVRECLVQIDDAIPDTNCSAAGAYQTAKLAATSRVKKHFGVE